VRNVEVEVLENCWFTERIAQYDAQGLLLESFSGANMFLDHHIFSFTE
jgi:hypothetical protein